MSCPLVRPLPGNRLKGAPKHAQRNCDRHRIQIAFPLPFLTCSPIHQSMIDSYPRLWIELLCVCNIIIVVVVAVVFIIFMPEELRLKLMEIAESPQSVTTEQQHVQKAVSGHIQRELLSADTIADMVSVMAFRWREGSKWCIARCRCKFKPRRRLQAFCHWGQCIATKVNSCADVLHVLNKDQQHDVAMPRQEQDTGNKFTQGLKSDLHFFSMTQVDVAMEYLVSVREK